MSIFNPKKYEGLSADIAAQIAADVEAAHNEQLTGAKLSFKQSMDDLDTKLKAAQATASAFDGLNASEVEVLKTLKGKEGEAQAALTALKADYDTKVKDLEEKSAELEANAFTMGLNGDITSHNATNKHHCVRSGLQDALVMTVRQRTKEIDGKTVFTNKDGSPFIKGDGYGDGAAFLQHLQAEIPDFFHSPTGSGATGNPIGGSAKQFKDMSEVERVDLYRKNPEQYKALKDS